MNEIIPAPEYLPATQPDNLPATQNDRIPQTDRMAALRQRALEAVEVWQPEPGELLVGEYTGHKQITHPRYGNQWQVFLKSDTGTAYAIWANQWIRHNLKAQCLAIGDLVAITYLGKRTTSTGTVHNAYSLIVDKS